MPDAERCGHLDHALGLIAVARNHELHIVHVLKHTLRCADEVLRSLLHRDTTEVEHDIVFRMNRLRTDIFRSQFNAVVDDINLRRGDVIASHAHILREHAHRDDACRCVHASTLDRIHLLIGRLATAIKLRRVNVHNQRFSREFLQRHARGIRQPIMRMNNIEFDTAECINAEACIARSCTKEVAGVVRCFSSAILHA